MNPRNTIFDAKRLIGRQYGDKTVQEDMKVRSTSTHSIHTTSPGSLQSAHRAFV